MGECNFSPSFLPTFFCSELGREPGSWRHVCGAPSRLALIRQTEDDAQHMLCLCYDTGTDVMGPM